MNFQEMGKVAGGKNVTREEYCATAKIIIDGGHTPGPEVAQLINGICEDSDAWN